MSELRAIRIERGPQGFGGPLIIRPTEQKNKVMYITGGGTAPECLKKIVELSGMTPVDGFHGSAPEEELAMVIVDCGGTLRCGIYPQKRIPTVNVMPVGKSGPLANFITEDIYVSAVTSKQISLAEEGEAVQAAEVSEKKAGGSKGHQIYMQLMNGVSHMLPFVVGGGILIALAFLIDGLSVDLSSLPADQRANFGTITPVAAVLKNIGGTAFGVMLPLLAGFIAMAIGDRPALAVGLVGGMIAANGKSGFLGALLAGFLAGYLILGLRKVCDKLPEALEKIAPVLIYPVVGVLLMGLCMTFVVEPIMGGINTGLNNALTGMGNSSKVILGLVLGGMMAIDMGGPFNKAAYVFGTAAIAAGNYDIMAAVMVGGMTPPCAIALASLLFKDKFTKEEREAGPTNFIMGLAFITEGAIPFAASDPVHVLPSCIVGSAAAGAISMFFNCTLMAPHGGIFVFPVVGNAMMYLVALVVGTLISAVLLGVLKKKVA